MAIWLILWLQHSVADNLLLYKILCLTWETVQTIYFTKAIKIRYFCNANVIPMYLFQFLKGDRGGSEMYNSKWGNGKGYKVT